MKIDTSFPHDYGLDLLDEFRPSVAGAQLFYYPGGTVSNRKDGLMVAITKPKESRWIAVVNRRYSPPAISYVGSFPHPKKFCVVATGFGCVIDSAMPAQWCEIACAPVLDVRTKNAAGLIFFSSFTDVAAYDSTGLRWRRSLCWDDLKITQITDQLIIGTGLDAPRNKTGRFQVNLESGEVLVAPKRQ